MTRPGRNSRVGIAALLLLALAAAACGGSQARPPQRREVILSTEAHDERVGEQTSMQVGGAMGFVEDPALAAYVEAIGKRVARYAPRGGFQYQFKIVDQDVPNAFALPGGYIYVSRGLLIMANSEDELAGVLGHEIIHVASRHAAARQSMIEGMPGVVQFLAGGAIAEYGREQERESDRLGQGLAGLAGYDPQGLAGFLTSLEFQERLRLGGSRLPGYFDSHPATSERTASASSRARMVAWQRQPEIAPGRAGYLARIDGLVVGTSASEGVFQDNRFLHPELGFTLRFPPDWDAQNTRQAVGAVSPQRDAMVSLELEARGDDPQRAASNFLEKVRAQGLRVDKMQPVKLGGLAGFRAEGRVSASGVSLPVHLTWIAHRGAIYRITGVASPRAGSRYDATFLNVARSFRLLPPEARQSIREQRLRIATARSDETLVQLSERTGNLWNVQETAVMNGLFANARLESGQLVKVALPERYAEGR
ncbi:MAG TPA: M48 family metalloprotease [Myxococcota bacterium]